MPPHIAKVKNLKPLRSKAGMFCVGATSDRRRAASHRQRLAISSLTKKDRRTLRSLRRCVAGTGLVVAGATKREAGRRYNLETVLVRVRLAKHPNQVRGGRDSIDHHRKQTTGNRTLMAEKGEDGGTDCGKSTTPTGNDLSVPRDRIVNCGQGGAS
jgi:hypothetical protein